MPRHLSLMSILKHSGYRLKFYIGSDPDFDNERLFLQQQGVDVLVGIDDYDNAYAKSPGSSWGYPDREVIGKFWKWTVEIHGSHTFRSSRP
jgi:uncharacterized sulfatase